MYLVSVLNKKIKQDQALESICSVCLGKAMVSPTWQALRGKAKPLPSLPILSNRMFPEPLRTGMRDLAGLQESPVDQEAAQQSQQLIQTS